MIICKNIKLTVIYARLNGKFFVITLRCMKKRRGRPRQKPGNAKKHLLQVRLAQTEKRGFAEAARLAGQALSVWVRDRLRQSAQQELERQGQPVPFLGKSEKS